MDAPTTQPRALRRTFFWLAVLVIIVVAGVYGWRTPPDVTPRGARMPVVSTPVSVVPAQNGQIARQLRSPGTVTPPVTVTIRARVEGVLESLHAEDGQYVYPDQLLATLDAEPFRIRLEQALGQQASRQAQLEMARRDLARYEKLYRQDSVARQLLESARAQVLELEGQVRSDQAAVDQAQLELGYTEIRAPLEGRLGLHQVDVGNLVRASDTDGLMVLTQSRPMDVLFSIPQTRLPELIHARQSQPDLVVTLQADPVGIIRGEGRLVAVDNRIDVATGTVLLKARFDNADESLFPNEFVRVTLELGQQEGLLVPLRAVQRGARGEYVYRVADDHTAQTVSVTTGVDDGHQVVILSGLQEGDRVVTEGIDRLRDGSPVEIISSETAQEPGS